MPSKPAGVDRRFLAPASLDAGVEVVLDPEESHHLARVLRLGPGDRVSLFDGRGRECLADVVTADRAAVRLRVVQAVEPVPEPAVQLSIVQAVLKGPAMDDVVRDATMIGAAVIQPISTARVSVKASVFASPSTGERWRRIALASAKQCRRAVLPAIHPPRDLRTWLAGATEELKLILVEPGAHHAARSLHGLARARRPRSAALLIGPEGGWTADELGAAAAAGCAPASLGHLTLRADAVALAAATVLRLLWELEP